MKKIILTLLLPASFSVAHSQELKNEIAKKEQGASNQTVAPKSEPVKSETVKTEMVASAAVKSTEKKAEENLDVNRPARLAVLSEDNKTPENSTRKYEYKGSKFKKVPLLDETKYYGNNHGKMVDYTKKYLANHTRTFAAVSSRNKAGKIFNMMDRVFDKYDIPHEMKYLSVIESALNNKALSPVGAYGPWQFMPTTGQWMGLTVTSSRDDRSDWSKSTHAACKYMTYLYDMMGDWLLVVASYNSGPRPVLNAIKKTGKRDYWAIKNYLPKETQNHVLAFVATASVFELIPEYASTNVPANFNWASINRKTPGLVNVDEEKDVDNPLTVKFGKSELEKMAIVRIKSPLDLDYLANYLETDRRQLGRWNFDYFEFIQDFKAGSSTYNLRIPKDKLDRFLQNRDYIERQSAKFR